MDQTRPSSWERTLEACLHVIVVGLPLYFNVQSYRIFEPDKALLLQWIAGVMAVAWVIHLARQPDAFRQLKDRIPGWAAWPLGLFAAGFLIATLFSTNFWLSVQGSYERLHGLLTMGSIAMVFVAALTVLRTGEQLQLLITSWLVGSFMVAGLALMQRMGLDPISWATDVTYRASSTQGNPVFLGAYFILAIPFSLHRLVHAISRTHRTMYAVLFLTQAAALFVTLSRGPLIGVAAGIASYFILRWIRLKQRRKIALVYGTGLGLFLLLAGLNLFAADAPFIRQSPTLTRIVNIFGTEEAGRSGQVRVLIWGSMLDMATDSPGRMLIGYGPETMRTAYPPFTPPGLSQVGYTEMAVDRGHSTLLDQWVTRGLLAPLTYLWLITALIFHGLRRQGLLDTSSQRRTFLLCWLGGGLVMPILLRLLTDGWAMVGIGIPLGMTAGLFVFMALSVRYGSPNSDHDGHAVLLAAILAHFVEAAFGFGTATSLTLLSLLIVFTVLNLPVGAPKPKEAEKRTNKRKKPAPAQSSYPIMPVMSLALLAMAFGYIPPFAQLSQHPLFITGLLVMMGLALFGLFAQYAEPQKGRIVILMGVLGVVLFGMMGWAGLQAPDGLSWSLAFFSLGLLGVLYLMILWMHRGDAFPLKAAIPLIIVYLLIGWRMLPGIQADQWFKHAWTELHSAGHVDASIPYYRKVLQFSPDEPHYQTFLSKALVDQALTGGSAEDPRFEEAAGLMSQALNRLPGHPDHLLNQARIVQTQARASSDSLQRALFVEESRPLFEKSATKQANNPIIWNEWGLTENLAGNYGEAISHYQTALAIDSTFYETHLNLGDLYAGQLRWAEAASAFQAGLRHNPNSIRGNSALGMAYARMNNLRGAIEQNETVLRLRPGDVNALKNLIILYQAVQDCPNALHYTREGMRLYPQDNAFRQQEVRLLQFCEASTPGPN